MEKNFRYIFNPQTGAYEGIARHPFPENCTEVRPHFSTSDFLPVWDFEGRWKLERRELFAQDMVYRGYLLDSEAIMARHSGEIISALGRLHTLVEIYRLEVQRNEKKTMENFNAQTDMHADILERHNGLEWRFNELIEIARSGNNRAINLLTHIENCVRPKPKKMSLWQRILSVFNL